ncbi:ABC transporter ATP-binding protein [Streptomyces sp. NPDC048718]|uniref:ABC transporter ATP-binding protein n=1 Tax=Streptomyces sp. NPDC048718 TaxID=3365587 RepID=UPI00371B85CC
MTTTSTPSGASGPSASASASASTSASASGASASGASAGTTLEELERRATAHRDRPSYGHDALIACDRLVRIFTTDGVEVQALQGLDLLVRKGELMALVGASGSGKSTLMNILAGLDVPTAGAATVAGCDLLAMDGKARLRYRRDVVGFVWQQTARNLLPYLSAAQNVALPMQLRGGGKDGAGGGRSKDKGKRAEELLSMLGISDLRDRRPHQLSGGQQQRVAIAVALANNPSVLLADEPTGELDSGTGEQIFAAFRRANEELGTTIVIVTHDQQVASEVRRTVAIRDGRTSSEVLRRTEVDAEGQESLVAREYAMLDRAGRLQLPAEYTEALAMRHRVALELESDHIGVWPDDAEH